MSVIPKQLKHPCNCFGHCGRFETDQHFHEMGSEGCVKTPPSGPLAAVESPPGFGKSEIPESVRQFTTGATRDTAEGKIDFEAFFSPLVLHAFGVHMLSHMKDASGAPRESDNWQKGIPMDAYMKSGWRHFFDWWSNHRDMKLVRKERIIRACCAVLFNVMGYLHEYLKANPEALKMFEDEAGYGK